MTDDAINDIRHDLSRLESKVDELRELKPQVIGNTASLAALRIVLHGTDGRGGLLTDYTRIEQQMKAILWTVRTIGTGTLITLVGIFYRLASTAPPQ